MSRPRRVGLPWYAPEHYEALRQSLTDGGNLPERYEAWRVSTEQVERVVQQSGVEVVRVPIEPDAFMAWCERAGLPANGATRLNMRPRLWSDDVRRICGSCMWMLASRS